MSGQPIKVTMGKKLPAATVNVTEINDIYSSYVTSLSVGTPYQTSNNICLDTSLTVNGIVSLNCTGDCAPSSPWFDTQASTSVISTFNGTRTMIYNVDEFDGTMYMDRMCLDITDANTCLEN